MDNCLSTVFAVVERKPTNILKHPAKETPKPVYSFSRAELDFEFFEKYNVPSDRIVSRLEKYGRPFFGDYLFDDKMEGACPPECLEKYRYAVACVYAELSKPECVSVCAGVRKTDIAPVYCVLDLEREEIVHMGGSTLDFTLNGNLLIFERKGVIEVLGQPNPEKITFNDCIIKVVFTDSNGWVFIAADKFGGIKQMWKVSNSDGVSHIC